MSRAKWLAGALAAVVGAAGAWAAPGEAGMNPAAKNVQITLTISKSQGSQPPRVVKMVGQEGTKTKMLIGWRMPIPMQSSSPDAGGKPMTNFIYQNVGVSAELAVSLLGGGRFGIDGTIELSGMREGQTAPGGEKAPVIGTFQQALRVITAEGKKLRIAEGPDPEGGTVSLDIEAAVLP